MRGEWKVVPSAKGAREPDAMTGNWREHIRKQPNKLAAYALKQYELLIFCKRKAPPVLFGRSVVDLFLFYVHIPV